MIRARTIALAGCLLVLAPAAFAEDAGKLKKALAAALSSGKTDEAQALIGRLGATNEVKAAKAIVNAAASFPQLELYDSALAALISMDGADVQAYFAKRARKAKNWLERYLLLNVCGDVKTAAARDALCEAGKEEKHPGTLQTLVPLLVKQRRKPAIDALIALVERAESRGYSDVAREGMAGLAAVTGERIQSGQDWRYWWDQVGDDFVIPTAKKEGAKPKGRMETGVRARITSRGESKYLERLVKADVVVVKGQFDNVGRVLQKLQIPHTSLKREEMATYEFQPHQVVIINCHAGPPGNEALKRLETFVAKGGYLFTSDWEMQHILLKAFPKALALKGRIEGHEGVDISPHPESIGHPYLRDVFSNKSPYRTASSMKWKVDPASDLQTADLPRGVEPLVYSNDLESLHGVGVVALTFRFDGKVLPKQKTKRKRRPRTGKKGEEQPRERPLRGGSVLHVIGHFQAQHDPKGDGFALQQLLGNFIVEKQKQRALQANRKRK